MKQEIVQSKGYRHFALKFKIPFFRHYFDLIIRTYPEFKDTLGITNRTEDGKYVVFLDYDDMNEEEIRKELARLQEDFQLTDFFIFKLDREGSWHAICLLKMSMDDCYWIMRNTCSDVAHINAPIYFKRSRWILRIGPKGQRSPPKFAFRQPNPHLNPLYGAYYHPDEIYWGLLHFLNQYYEVPITHLEKEQINACKNLLVQFQPYPTFNRVD